MRRSFQKLLLGVVTFVVAASMTATLPTPDAGAEGGIDPESPGFIETQERLIEASRQARELRNTYPGFAMTELEPEARVLKLYWQNPAAELNRQVRGIAAEQRVVIEFLPAKYVEAELKAAVDEAMLMEGVTSASFSTPDGIEVTVADQASAPAARAPQAAIDGVDVVSATVDSVVATADRNNDRSPWTGGAGVSYGTSTHPGCSTAFGARDSQGSNFLISAGHCFEANGKPARTKDGVLMGYTQRYDPVTDSVLIKVNSISARAYNGYKSEPGRSARVSGLNDFTEKGQYVCNIGARSGAVCGVKVTSHYYKYFLDSVPNVQIIGYRATQTKTGGIHAVAGGDSGGPVIQNLAYGNVRAAGVVSAGVTSTKLTCPSNVGSTECYRDIVYVGAFELQYSGLKIIFS